MGLEVSVGLLADLKRHDTEGYQWRRSQLDEVMALLRSRGYEGWDELEESVGLGMRDHVSSFPYSFLSALRRAYAWSVERTAEALPSIGDDYISSEDETLIDEVARTMESHLLCHSPTEGVYVPVDIPDPLFDDSRDPVLQSAQSDGDIAVSVHAA